MKKRRHTLDVLIFFLFRIAVNKSVSDLTLPARSRPDRPVDPRRETSVPPDLTRLQSSGDDESLQGSLSETRLNVYRTSSPVITPNPSTTSALSLPSSSPSTSTLQRNFLSQTKQCKGYNGENSGNEAENYKPRSSGHSLMAQSTEQRSSRIRELRNRFLGIAANNNNNNNNSICRNGINNKNNNIHIYKGFVKGKSNYATPVHMATRGQRSQSLEPAELEAVGGNVGGAGRSWLSGGGMHSRSSSLESSGRVRDFGLDSRCESVTAPAALHQG